MKLVLVASRGQRLTIIIVTRVSLYVIKYATNCRYYCVLSFFFRYSSNYSVCFDALKVKDKKEIQRKGM
jgi:hypothetical protein